MKINLKNGIDKLLFGMKQKDVEAIYGKPDRNYKDEDENQILVYNKLKSRLTFYQEEDFKLGYIVASGADLELFGNTIIGKKISEVKNDLVAKNITKFTQEEFDTFENYFNEENLVIFLAVKSFLTSAIFLPIMVFPNNSKSEPEATIYPNLKSSSW